MNKVDEINQFCLKQMEESVDKPGGFNNGMWLVCCKIHGYIVGLRGKLEIIKE